MSIRAIFIRLTHRRPEGAAMNTYSTFRNTGLATVIVAALAGILSNALAADQKVVYARELPEQSAVTVLPEVVVTASRLEW